MHKFTQKDLFLAEYLNVVFYNQKGLLSIIKNSDILSELQHKLLQKPRVEFFTKDFNGHEIKFVLIDLSKIDDLEYALSTIFKVAGTLHLSKVHISKIKDKELRSLITYKILTLNYNFTKYLTKKPQKIEFFFNVDSQDSQENEIIQREINSCNFARNLVDEPSNILTTEEFAKRCQERFKDKTNIKLKVLDESQLKSLGMNALLAVGKGSAHSSKVLVFEYLPKDGASVDLSLVGKGVCFDSGGISLKPSLAMGEMISDMAGAGLVVGMMDFISYLQPMKNIVGIVGLVENMPGGNAFKPGDIITTMSKKTVEVNNTDAEGRLVLADILSYIQAKYDVSTVLDFATLTGAISIALGAHICGIMGNDDKLASSINIAAKESSELVWRLPLHPQFSRYMRSKRADLSNISSAGRLGASITAASFLAEFINKDVKWMHFDMAAVAFKQNILFRTNMSTGFGFKLLSNFIKKMK